MLKRTTILTSQTPFHYYSFENGYYPTKASQQALKTLLRCVKRREGTAVVLGSVGTGKSLLCSLLADNLGDDLFAVSLNNTNDCTPKALYQSILFELERPYIGMDENEMRLDVLDMLTDPGRFPLGLVLIIDEAHNLPQETLEEIRQLTNGRTRRASNLSVVLCGDLRLEENLSHPRLESFQQRISARVCLDPWSKSEVSDYISARLKAFRDKVPPKSVDRIKKFSVEGCNSIYTATGGVQRLVVQLCDQAYLSAVEAKIPCVEADFVQSVWARIQQLPDPCEALERKSASENSCVEFGSLDDDSLFDSGLGASFDPDTASADAPEGNSSESDSSESDSDAADEDRFKINFDSLDEAEGKFSELVDTPLENEEDRVPTPIEFSDRPLENALSRANNIIDSIDKIEAYFTSYCTVDYIESPLSEGSSSVQDAAPAPETFSVPAELNSENELSGAESESSSAAFARPIGYLNPFEETFQQEEAVRLDDAHPVPPSPFAKNHSGMVTSAAPKKQGVY